MYIDNNIAELNSEVTTDGAQFWAYVSPQHETARFVSDWKVTIEEEDGNWSGTITSENPRKILQSPSLSGVFNVRVEAVVGSILQPRELYPQAGSKPDIGCKPNCAAMVGIIAAQGGEDAFYWTVWDATCQPLNDLEKESSKNS